MTRLKYTLSEIFELEDLRRVVAGWKVKSKKIVFTNGVYDILHRGHVTLLSEAAQLGDKLVVGLNSDESVKRLNKGPERPVNAQADRAIVLASLRVVDAVVIFDADTPYEVIKVLEPDVLVKGGDYDVNETDPRSSAYIVGSDLQKEAERDVVVIPTVKGYSTTSILKRAGNEQN